MNQIEEIASKHLGSKQGEYETPDDVDPSLLVAIPRSLNREAHGIHSYGMIFVGSDAWNCYEFSTLTKNGLPICGIVKITYSSLSPNIVESKSLKLYLNSYNMARLIYNKKQIVDVLAQIKKDVSACVGMEVSVNIKMNGSLYGEPMRHAYYDLVDEVKGIGEIEFSHEKMSPHDLKLEDRPGLQGYARYTTNLLRSNCRVTNQPDWGDVFVYMDGARVVTAESLLKYIISMRKENHFHEEICELLYKGLYDKMSEGNKQPFDLLVACLYTRRGGIDINPVRASSYKLLFDECAFNVGDAFCQKTLRQ